MSIIDKYTYRVTWSDVDEEFVGLCAEMPCLSWLAKTQVKALEGILNVVAEALKDLEANKEEIPQPLSLKMRSVHRGLKQAAEGKLKSLGTFAKHAHMKRGKPASTR